MLPFAPHSYPGCKFEPHLSYKGDTKMKLNVIDSNVAEDLAPMALTVVSGMIFLAISVLALFASL